MSMLHVPPAGVRTAPVPEKKHASKEIEKSAAFAPVKPLTAVMVAGVAEPFPMVTVSNCVLPADAWKFKGLGLADTRAEPVPFMATVYGVPDGPV